MKLQLSRDVQLPLDAVTQTFAVLGKRGSGKTNTASVLAEQLVGRGLPIVYVDPIGVTYGLRHSRDGNGPGLPIIILGGEHADVPLEETGGAVVADFIVEHRPSAVLDLGLFSKSAQRRFMVDFTERLYHKNRAALHVMLDECDTFVPQRIDHGGERLVGAVNDLVRKGRARGLGVTLISQRPALVSKDVLTQVETLIAHRMTGPQDRDAVERWIEHNADQGADDVLASLQTLADGEAWVWSPSWLKTLVRTRIALRATFDSSATPKPGEKVGPLTRGAAVDLGALRERLAATIERAKADDPRELKRRITELEKQTKSVPSKDQEKHLTAVRDEVIGLRHSVIELDKKLEVVGALYMDHRQNVVKTWVRIEAMIDQITTAGIFLPSQTTQPPPERFSFTAHPHDKVAPGPAATIPNGQRRILLALARYGTCSKGKLAILARYASNGGGFNNNLGALRTAGRIEGTDPLEVTHDGRRVLGSFDPLPEDPESLFNDWAQHPMLGRAHREIMRVLKHRGRAMTKENIAAACQPPYEEAGGGFNNALSRLRTLGIIEGRGEINLTEQLRG
jgi:uncharacterized protein